MTTFTRGAAVVLGAALFVCAAGAGAMAQGPGGPGGRRGGPMARGPMGPGGAIDLPLAQLNLTPQQRDQVQTIMGSHKDELQALGDRQMAARQALDQAIAADAIDEGAIRQKAADLGAVEADMGVVRAHIRAEVLQVLTPDQQRQAKTLAANRPAPPQGRGRGR
jgi:Spy/CpxP family protein refolding chaperone